MKNKSLLFYFLLALASPVLAQKTCKVEGVVENANEIRSVLFFLMDKNDEMPDVPNVQVDLNGGKFEAEIPVEKPTITNIQAKRKDGGHDTAHIILLPGEKLQVTFDGAFFTLDGSKFYKQWGAAEGNARSYTKRMRQIVDRSYGLTEEQRKDSIPKLEAEYQKLAEGRSKAYQAYYDTHKKEEGCVLFYVLNIGGIMEYYDTLDPSVKNGSCANILTSEYNRVKAERAVREKEEAAKKALQENTSEGKMFVDFEAEYNGKVQKLSDYVGKGKYVLVDFWASWCGPCKAEIPNLIRAWEKYHGDRFEVLGVATWDKPADTEKSIEQMKIPYPQIMNAQKAGSDAYGIQGIPQIILFAPDGTILKRDLRGAQIEQTIKGLLER